MIERYISYIKQQCRFRYLGSGCGVCVQMCIQLGYDNIIHIPSYLSSSRTNLTLLGLAYNYQWLSYGSSIWQIEHIKVVFIQKTLHLPYLWCVVHLKLCSPIFPFWEEMWCRTFTDRDRRCASPSSIWCKSGCPWIQIVIDNILKQITEPSQMFYWIMTLCLLKNTNDSKALVL